MIAPIRRRRFPAPAPLTRPARAASLLAALGLAVTGCATFADSAPAFSPQPTLTPNIATVIPPDAGGVAATSSASPTPSTPGTTGEADPCAPEPLPVVAVCLDAPWGLAPLPSGDAALVGERLTGRVLSVKAGERPDEVATIADLDASHGGGLLGVALSPYFAEDQLVYAYVTTATDARILRFAIGQAPKAIVTGLPVGGDRPGGAIAFDAAGLLYVVTGSAAASASTPVTASPSTTPATTAGMTTASAPSSGGSAPSSSDSAPTGGVEFGDATLASSVLRFDTSGRPATQNSSGTALFASGFTDVSGMCLLPTGRVAVMDHRPAGDVLVPLDDGADYTQLTSTETLWTYRAGAGGGVDCAVADGALAATARSAGVLSRIEMRPAGGFAGAPSSLLDGEYGLLRTLTTGPGEMLWLTTANHPAARDADARGSVSSKPDSADDRVIVLPPSGGGGGDGGLD